MWTKAYSGTLAVLLLLRVALLWFASGARRRFRRLILDHGHSSVLFDKGFAGDAPNVCFTDFVNLIYAAEQFTPIAPTKLVSGQLVGQALVVPQSANQVCFGASFHHLQLLVADVFVL